MGKFKKFKNSRNGEVQGMGVYEEWVKLNLRGRCKGGRRNLLLILSA